jgi:hypothetical protein
MLASSSYGGFIKGYEERELLDSSYKELFQKEVWRSLLFSINITRCERGQSREGMLALSSYERFMTGRKRSGGEHGLI